MTSADVCLEKRPHSVQSCYRVEHLPSQTIFVRVQTLTESVPYNFAIRFLTRSTLIRNSWCELQPEMFVRFICEHKKLQMIRQHPGTEHSSGELTAAGLRFYSFRTLITFLCKNFAHTEKRLVYRTKSGTTVSDIRSHVLANRKCWEALVNQTLNLTEKK